MWREGVPCLPHYLFRDGLVVELGGQVEDGFNSETLEVFSRNVKEVIQSNLIMSRNVIVSQNKL